MGKLYITMKTPDCLDYALEQFTRYEVSSLDEEPVAEDQQAEEMAEELKEKLAQWFRYGESVTLVYDIEADTMEVQRAR